MALFGFGKKKEEEKSCCSGGQELKSTFANVKQAVAERRSTKIQDNGGECPCCQK